MVANITLKFYHGELGGPEGQLLTDWVGENRSLASEIYLGCLYLGWMHQLDISVLNLKERSRLKVGNFQGWNEKHRNGKIGSE